MKITNGALDCVDERNYNYSEIAGGTEIKDFVLLDDGSIQDQYKEGYPYGCVYFSSSMNDNYCNFRDGDKARSTGGELCEASETRDPKKGDYLINGPKLLKKLGHIEGYFQCAENIEDMKKALSENRPIHTGTNKISWGETKNNNNIAVICDETSIGHAFHIIGYNASGEIKKQGKYTIPNNVFICKDSSNSFDNGLFYINFENIDCLFYTKMIFENKLFPILSYKQKIMNDLKLESAKKAFEMGIWNGERPKDNISREECSAMIYRLFEKIAKKVDEE